MMSNLFDKESVFPNDYVHDSVRTDFVNLSLHSSFPDLFISKDIRFALGHVYYKSLASFLSFILLIFFSTKKHNLPTSNTYDCTEKNKKANLICPWACLLRAKSKSQIRGLGKLGRQGAICRFQKELSWRFGTLHIFC